MEWLTDLLDKLAHFHTLPYTPQNVVTKGMCHFAFGYLLGLLSLPVWAMLAALHIVDPTTGVTTLRNRFNALIAFPLRVAVVAAIVNVGVDIDHLILLGGPRADHGRVLHGAAFWIGGMIAAICTVQAIRLVRRPSFSEATLQDYLMGAFAGFSAVLHVFEDHLRDWWF